MQAPASEQGIFWDHRYQSEGAIWGESPSPTARIAERYIAAGARVLDIGFGYGRDTAFLIRQGCRVTGIDLSVEGRRRTEERLRAEGLKAELLVTGRFEDSPLLSDGAFDLTLSHRVAHLLVGAEARHQFVKRSEQIVRPGGLLCIGARNFDDLNLADMVQVEDQVYEYRRRPGHRICYWDDEAFTRAFGGAFTILSLTRAVEPESVTQPVPCHLTVMVGVKKLEA